MFIKDKERIIDGVGAEVVLTRNGFVEIWTDDFPDKPTNTMDFLFTFISFDYSYSLDFNEFKDIESFKNETKTGYLVYPLLKDYYGELSLSNDSDVKFFAYVEKEKIYKEYNCKKITKNIKDKIEGLLWSELQTFNDFISGNVYGVTMYNSDNPEGDSIGGFYGRDAVDNGMEDYIGEILYAFPITKTATLTRLDNQELFSYMNLSKYITNLKLNTSFNDLGELVEIDGELFSKKTFFEDVFEGEENDVTKKIKEIIVNTLKGLE